MSDRTIYNERVKLSASLANLTAVGLITVGVTTPVVSTLYGVAPWADKPSIVVIAVVWCAAVAMTAHLVALRILGDLVDEQ